MRQKVLFRCKNVSEFRVVAGYGGGNEVVARGESQRIGAGVPF